MKCFIDNREVDMDPREGIAITLSIASVTEIETGRTGYSKTIRLPMSLRNQGILGGAGDPHAPELFNQNEHTARLEARGCTVIEGVPMITRLERNPSGSGGWYHLNIIGAGKAWIALAAGRMFSDLPVPFEMSLSAPAVLNSWTGESPVRFFPVQHDRFTLASETIQGGVRMLTFEDYFPFLQVRSLLDAVAAQGGYTIRSAFMDSDFFRSLYMSGKYREHDPSIPNERMGFLAGRFSASTSTADRFGRVYADPLTTLNSMGNFVDTADPEEEQSGVILADVYNHNNSLRKVDGRIGFFPVEAVVAGFEYNVRYRSDYRIASRTELGCFNRLYLDDGLERQFQVMNRYEDRRESYRVNRSYRLIVFNHVAGNSYRFTYERIDDVQGNTTTVALKTFAERTTTIVSAAEEAVTLPRLWIKNPDDSYSLYTQDWALYDGYVAETGQIDVRITARSAARRIHPSQPCYFDQVYLGGAEEGMALTLSEKVTLRPVFVSHPGEGSTIQFADVAAHDIRQIDFVHAVKQLFNLYFYTDTLAKEILVEPREAFYTDRLVEWSDKIDFERPVSVEELGADQSRTLTLRYQPGDGSVARWDSANRQVLGRWSAEIRNRFARDSEHTYYNPLFTASLNRRAVYPDAPDASILQVGDRDSDGGNPQTENLNFPAKIVSYAGLQTLPENQWWGWPSYGKQYPLIAFHQEDASVPSLCFEARDGQSGLHRYYDKTVELYNTGRRITLYLYLQPEDVEPFIFPNDRMQDFRALFKLRIDGEAILCRLEAIVDYNPARPGSTRCVFLKNV